MKIPNGFIKESGVYRRGNYIFNGRHIFKEATLLPTKEERDSLVQTKFETLDDSIRAALQYSSDIGQELRTKDIYIDKVKDGEFKVSEKQSNKTVAIITPDNNVYELKFTEIPEQDDKSLAPDKDTAKAPKEQKDVETKPKELDDLKEATYDDDFEEEGKEEFPSEEPVAEEPTGEDVPSEEVPEDKSVEPMDSAYFIRRPQNIEDLQNKIDRHLVNMATYQIVDEIELSEEEFNNYASNLRQDTKFLKSFRPNPTNADFTCIAVKSPDGTTLLVDNSGYDSAQYVSIV